MIELERILLWIKNLSKKEIRQIVAIPKEEKAFLEQLTDDEIALLKSMSEYQAMVYLEATA